uniref:Large ribosomal subunit protein bL32c n=1 Tax=Monomorphina parapyrum TaxID=1664066 RepID=A0A0G3VJR2_9EUGL|nr:ribosomal protein L32 [Monomorphina parapyrum]AKL78930.1 ribosomal protein L32 [Monomorphina parapyrum]
MAVPKKKMSKSRRDSRKSTWKKKASKKVLIALSIGKSFLEKNSSNNFIFS